MRRKELNGLPAETRFGDLSFLGNGIQFLEHFLV
jgi:hypothetical protein